MPKMHIRIIAAEATRSAINLEEFRKEIKHATGLNVEILSKEEREYIDALGVASGFSDISDLEMGPWGGARRSRERPRLLGELT